VIFEAFLQPVFDLSPFQVNLVKADPENEKEKFHRIPDWSIRVCEAPGEWIIIHIVIFILAQLLDILYGIPGGIRVRVRVEVGVNEGVSEPSPVIRSGYGTGNVRWMKISFQMVLRVEEGHIQALP
jgi:hypothetical protein